MWEDNFMFHTSDSILFGTLLTWLGKASVIWILSPTEWWISRSMMRSYQDLWKSSLLLFWLGWVLCRLLNRFRDATWNFSACPLVQIYSWLALSNILILWQHRYSVAVPFLTDLAELPVVDQTRTLACAFSPGIVSLSWGWTVLAWACVIPCLGKQGACALPVSGKPNKAQGLIRREGPDTGKTKPAVGFILVDRPETSLTACFASPVPSDATGS